jgi:AraC-like DNA-binding protein
VSVREVVGVEVSAEVGILPDMYRERVSRLDGAVVWQTTRDPGQETPKRVLPDGCMDLLWSGGELIVAGPDTTAYVGSGPPATYTGLRFAPGTAPGILGVPAQELRDQRVPLADLWPAERVRRLTARVAAADAPGRVMEELALDLAGPPDPVVTELVRQLRTGEPVAAIADDSGFSERQLHRRSLALFGYGPKLLTRILRLQHALELARRGLPPAAVAATTGYADQPHLARDVKSLAGVPLRSLLG